MKKYLSLFVLFCVPSLLASVLGSVRVVVFDQKNLPIPNAQVVIRAKASEWSKTAKTSADGQLQFDIVPAGQYVVSVEADGFEVADTEIEVISDSVAPVQLQRSVVQRSVTGAGKAAEVTAAQALLDRIAMLEKRLSEVEGHTAPSDSQAALQAQRSSSIPAITQAATQPGAQVSPEPIAQDSAQDSNAPQALLERIKMAEQRISDLESNTVLSEPETRVRRVEVYVDEDGVQHDDPVPGARRTVTYQRERVYRRQTISEKIEEALSAEAESSVQVGVSAALSTQAAIRTSGEPTEADGHAYALGSADLFFTARVAQNTLFFADIVGLSGPSPDNEIGGLTLVNGFSARLVRQNELNLREAWLRTELFSQTLAVTAGRVDLTNYFDRNTAANDEFSQFLSDALVNNPMLGLAVNGTGVAAVFDPKRGVNFKFGAQQSNTEALNLSDSLFTMTEIGYLATPLSLGEGNYRVWYRLDNSPMRHRTAFGVSLDQKLAPMFTLFGRFGSAQADIRRDYFYSGGFQLHRGVVFFPSDSWGMGYAHTDLGSGPKERLVEGYYNLGMTEKLRLSFHLTHVLEKEPTLSNRSYLVPGVRLESSF